MNNAIKMILSGLAGLLIGVEVTHLYEGKKYVKRVDAEIERLDNMNKRLKTLLDDQETIDTVADNAIKNYIVNDEEVINDLVATEHSVEPYIISEEEFGEYPDYDIRHLNWNPERAEMTDETEDLMECDVNITFGQNNLESFDNNGYLYIRDDIKQIDYEIARVDI